MLQTGNFDCCFIQEIKRSSLSDNEVSSIWGSGKCGWEAKFSIGRSGGLISVWREGLFDVINSLSGDGYVGLCVNQNGCLLYLINVYSSCNLDGKRRLWEELLRCKSELQAGDWCIGGDFNAVLSSSERRGVSQNSSSMERT